MISANATRLLLLLGVTAYAWSAEELVVDFESAVPLLADSRRTASRDGKKKALYSRSPVNPG